jgi:protein-tyrosine phosphatase
MPMAQHSILLVCTGNICRSPMGEALLRARLGPLVQVQSAGTHAASRGEPVDARAAAVLARREIAPLPRRWRSRRAKPELLDGFDLILAMDEDNLRHLRELAPAPLHERLRLYLDLVPGMSGSEVPDPYYGPPQGFERVLDLLEQGAQALQRRLLQSASLR